MNYNLTVIIPTLNESQVIERMIIQVAVILKKENLNGQILIVDDNSWDGTQDIVRTMTMTYPNVSILVRHHDRGLSQSIVDGFHLEVDSCSPIFIVMDADGQHPAEKIPELYQKIKEGDDIVIGSRYLDGGEIKNWSFTRKVVSWGATFLARLFFPHITDPVSGFFAVKKSVVKDAPLKPQGYKILLEILGKGHWKKVIEIPFTFGERMSGESKLKPQTIIEFQKQILDLAYYTVTHKEAPAYTEFSRMFKFMVVGMTGVIVNVGFLFIITEGFGIYFMFSSLIAIEASIFSNYILNDIWTFGDITDNKYSWSERLIRFQMVSVMGVLINMSTLYLLTTVFGLYYVIANLVGIALAFSWNFLVNRKFTWLKSEMAEEIIVNQP